MKIGDHVKSKVKYPFDVMVYGKIYSIPTIIEGRVEGFEMDGKMVYIDTFYGPLLFPVSIFPTTHPAPAQTPPPSPPA